MRRRPGTEWKGVTEMSEVETTRSAAAMTPDEMFAEVVRLAATQVGADPAGISGQTHFVNDLGFDSLDQVEYAMALEERFDLAITDEEAESIQTVGAALEKVRELLAVRGGREQP